MRIDLWQGDITQLDVDVIVNTASESLLGAVDVDGVMDGVIHRAAGPQLLEACLRFPEIRSGVRCPPGEVRSTPGFGLRAKHVFHAVGPVWRDGKHDEPALLANCYWQSLKLAKQMLLHSIAFPAISCGIGAYPLHQAACIAVTETRAWLRLHAMPKHIVLVAGNNAAYKAYQRALASQNTAAA